MRQPSNNSKPESPWTNAFFVPAEQIVPQNPFTQLPSVINSLVFPQDSKVAFSNLEFPQQPREPTKEELAQLVKRFEPLLVSVNSSAGKSKGGHVVSHSNYNTPIATSKGRLRGKSRAWGDAPKEVQAAVCNLICSKLEGSGFSKEEIAYALGVCRIESGFNPDAASRVSSASGLAQFLTGTGKSIFKKQNKSLDRSRSVLPSRGGPPSRQSYDPFDAEQNISLFIVYLREQLSFAKKKANDPKYVPRGVSSKYWKSLNYSEKLYLLAYKYHHDGPTGNYGGLGIAQKKHLPDLCEKAKGCLASPLKK